MKQDTFDLIKKISKDNKRIGTHKDSDQQFFLIEPILFAHMVEDLEKMNDALHNIQIIASTMEDTEQINEIFKTADKAQFDC